MAARIITLQSPEVIDYPRLTITLRQKTITPLIEKTDALVQKDYFSLDNERSCVPHFRRSKKCVVGVCMPSRKLWALLFSAVLVITTSVSLYGQSTYGTVDGSVLDSSGAAISDAQVTLTNKGTQEKRVQNTGAEGLFQFVNVFSGQYRLDIEKAGFKHFTRDPVVVEPVELHRRRTAVAGLHYPRPWVPEACEVGRDMEVVRDDQPGVGLGRDP